MSGSADTPNGSQPVEIRLPSRKVRILTSWKVWTLLLVMGLLGIGISLTMPIVHRLRALRYLDRHQNIATYRLSDEHEDWPKRYGAWVNALRDVEELKITAVSDEVLRHVSVLDEVQTLLLVESESQPISARGLECLHPFKRLQTVELVGQGFTDQAIADFFATHPQLYSVFLMDTGAGRETLEELSQIPTINQLAIFSRSLNDEAFRGLAPLPNIFSFDANGGAIIVPNGSRAARNSCISHWIGQR